MGVMAQWGYCGSRSRAVLQASLSRGGSEDNRSQSKDGTNEGSGVLAGDRVAAREDFPSTDQNARSCADRHCLCRLLGLARNVSLFSLLIAYCSPGVAVGQLLSERGRVVEESIAEGSEALRQTIIQTVAEAGGNVREDAIHLAVGFSTGHFGLDPLHAEGCRLIARRLADQLLWPGDRFSVFAWEFGIWDHRPGNNWGIRVDGTGEDVIRDFNDILPRTPSSESVGGHDTELTIVQAVDRLGDRNVVLVLLTNSVASVRGRAEQSLLGENDRSFVDRMGRLLRAPSVNRAGASLVLTFRIELPDGRVTDRTAEALVLVSKPFVGSRLSTTRPDQVTRSSAEPKDPVRPSEIPPPPCPETRLPVFVIVALLLLGGLVVAMLIPGLRDSIVQWISSVTSAKHWKLTLDGALVNTDGKVKDDILRTLVGEGLADKSDSNIVLRGMPKEEFLVIRYAGAGRLDLEAKPAVKSWEIGDEAVAGKSYQIRGEGVYRLTIRAAGEKDGVPGEQRQTVELELRRE